MDLNNRRTGKDATEPRALGLLGHSVMFYEQMIEIVVKFLLNMIFGEEKRAKIRHFGSKIVSYVMNSAHLVKIGIS